MSKIIKILYVFTLLAFLAVSFAVFASCDRPIPQTSFLESEIPQSQVVLRVYTAEYCRPCHQEKPYVDAIRASGKISVEIVDVTPDRRIADEAGVIDLPTYRVFINGQLYWQGHSIAPIYRQVVGGG